MGKEILVKDNTSPLMRSDKGSFVPTAVITLIYDVSSINIGQHGELYLFLCLFLTSKAFNIAKLAGGMMRVLSFFEVDIVLAVNWWVAFSIFDCMHPG